MKKDLYAIIETGGKQYKVSPGDKLEVDFLNAGNGKEAFLFDDIDTGPATLP